MNWWQITGALWAAALVAAVLVMTCAELRCRQIRRRQRKALEARAVELIIRQFDIDLERAYAAGIVAGRIQRYAEGPGSRPTFWASDDPEIMAQRRGVQDGWERADADLADMDNGGWEGLVEDWKRDATA